MECCKLGPKVRCATFPLAPGKCAALREVHSTIGALNLFRAKFFGSELLGGGEGVGGGNLYVGFDAGSFSVGLGDGVDGPGKRHANHKMAVNSVTGDGMGAASGGLADDGGTFQILEVVAEFFGT
jgi:hypothetical protein